MKVGFVHPLDFAVPRLKCLVVMSRRARGDRRRGRSVCQLVGSESQCLSFPFLSFPVASVKMGSSSLVFGHCNF